MAGCLPFDAYGETESCRAFNQKVLTYVERIRPNVVMISANWARPLSAPESSASLVSEIRRIAGTGSKIIVIGPSPQYANALPSIYISVEHFGMTSANRLEPFVPATDKFMRSMLRGEPHVEYISLLDLMCQGGVCPLLAMNAPIAWDEGHLTEEGSVWIGSLIANSSDFLRQESQVAR
jgi:hypothetical protein